MGWFKKDVYNKYIKLYAVTKKDDNNAFLTLTLTQNEALEYVEQKVFVDHFNHFKLWCDLRKYDIKDKEKQDEYKKDCIKIDEYDNYLIHSVKYKYKEVVAIMRMFGKCIPIGCSFDTQAEVDYINEVFFANKVAKKFCQDLEKELEKESIENGE